MNGILSTLLRNRHTSGSAIAYAAVKIGSQIAATWWPNHKAQIESTANNLEALAVAYMGFAAGDAVQSKKQVEDLAEKTKQAVESGNTTVLIPPPKP